MTTAGNKTLSNLITDGFEIEQHEAKAVGAIGYMGRILVQCTLPHSKLSENYYSRKNGNFKLHLSSLPNVGLPYGSVPRLLLAWLTTEAVRTKERELVLGDNLSGFMRELGIVPTGGRWGSITRLREQSKRLFNASIQCTYEDGDIRNDKMQRLDVAQSTDLWWSNTSEQRSLFPSTVVLAEPFYKEITKSPVPIDMRALKALSKSPLALDIYNWITYRNSYLKSRTNIPWELLQFQFGCNYKDTRMFKFKFKDALKKVAVVYPKLNISESDNGLVLLPSKTSIKKVAV
jgi:hypothetical protein